MWSSARFRRSANVLGLSSVDVQKSLKNSRTISRRRSISCLLGEASDVMPIWWVSGRTATLSAKALPLPWYQQLHCVRSDQNYRSTDRPAPTMILIQPDIVTIAPCSHRKLDLFVCGDHSGCNARG